MPSRAAFLDQMATAYWKLARLQLIESGVYGARSQTNELAGFLRQLRSQDDDEPEPEADPEPGSAEALGAAYLRDSNGSRALVSLSHMEARLERSFLRAYRELNKQSQPSPFPATNPPLSIASSSPPSAPKTVALQRQPAS